MNDQPPTTPNQSSLPTWFADSSPITPPTPQPTKSRKYRSLFIGIVVILAIIGSIIWYVIATNAAKVEAFQQFRGAYEQIETGFVNFDDITEPENLSSDELANNWKTYLSAFDTLSTTSIYKDNQQLVEDIRSRSLTFKTYTSGVIPALTRYLSECSASGDDEMAYETACRGYIQTAIDADDTLTGETLRELHTLLTQMSQDRNPTQAQFDTILDLQEKVFAVGRTMQTTVRPKVIEFGKKVGVEMPTAEVD